MGPNFLLDGLASSAGWELDESGSGSGEAGSGPPLVPPAPQMPPQPPSDPLPLMPPLVPPATFSVRSEVIGFILVVLASTGICISINMCVQAPSSLALYHNVQIAAVKPSLAAKPPRSILA